MAQRRMFSPSIVESDAFLDMSSSSQALYFHLGMNADDDGFVNPRRIMKTMSASEDDLNLLILKRFVLPFNNGVIVIKHWGINNLIQKDRYHATIYQEQFLTLKVKENGAYTDSVNKVLTESSLVQSREESSPVNKVLTGSKKPIKDEEEEKTDIYIKNQEYIKQNKSTYLDGKFNYPSKDGLFDWKYLIDHGKGLHPTKLFVAKYMQMKQKLSDGIYKYEYKDKKAVINIYDSERKCAKQLADMFTYQEFQDLIEFTDKETWDTKLKQYRFEYKLSTLVKYSAKFNGQKDD
jgi:hypothetical protein